MHAGKHTYTNVHPSKFGLMGGSQININIPAAVGLKTKSDAGSIDLAMQKSRIYPWSRDAHEWAILPTNVVNVSCDGGYLSLIPTFDANKLLVGGFIPFQKY